ncbi:diguanylate cyclase [Enterobacteriaceae bacterium RIT691]|nr:diguanylate cyclase [Enterobacteriaceae bacterium RIT691]
MIDGTAENYLNVKDRNAVGKTTPTLHSDMVAYIKTTTDELNKTDGLMVPEYFYSNVHINSDEQKRAVTIGVPVIKNLFSGKNHIVAGVMVFDVTDDDLKKVLTDMEQKSKATFDGYSIDMKSINTDDVNMPLIANNSFLPDIKLKNEKIISSYHLSSKISFLGLVLPYKVVLIILNAAMMLYFLTYVKVKTNNVALMRKLSVDTLTKAVSREGGLMITNKIKKKDEFVLVLIDLDDFKPINDTYGHQAGDDALIHFSGFILDNIRSCDYLIRMGGDEFILLIKKGTLPGAYHKVTEIAEKIKPLQCMNDEIKLSFSFGMSVVEDNFMSSYKDADERLYKMKRDKKAASHRVA